MLITLPIWQNKQDVNSEAKAIVVRGHEVAATPPTIKV